MSIDFDGVDDDVTIGDVAAIDITGTALTLACWVNLDVTTATMFFIAKRNAGVAIQYSLYFDDASDRIRFEVADGGITPGLVANTSAITAGTWFHCAGILSGSEMRAYRNGVASADSGEGVSIGNTTNALKLGEAGSIATDNDFPLNGKLAEVGIWNVRLSDGEITSLAGGVSPGLVRRNSLKGYWPLWSTAHLMDLSGNANAGTLTGGLNAAHAPVAPMIWEEDETYGASAAAAVSGGMTLLSVG